MTINEWIDEYCEDNDVELPDDIPDTNTALQFLSLASNNGGGGDFSTCTLTLNNQTNTGSGFYAPNIYDDGEYTYLAPGGFFEDNTSRTFQIVLYKNMCEINIDSTVFDISVSGNITSYGQPGVYYITGDCSITLTELEG